MKKQLFKNKKTSIHDHIARVGSYHSTRYTYINGYYEAGKELVNIAINETHGVYKKNILFYPICYTYRHYLELALKSLIIDTETLYDKMDELGFLQNGILSKKMANNLNNTHSLNKLFDLFIDRLSFVSNEKFPKDIKEYIKQMDNIDKNGQKFCYHEDKNKKLSFSNQEDFDLQNISKIMEEVYSSLRGVDSWLDYYIAMSNDILSEYEESMKEYYY